MVKVLVIYHGNCDDGFAAAYAVRQGFAAMGMPEPEFYAGSYGKEPPDCTGMDVILVDFSYKRPVLELLKQQANSLIILDHHKTAQADLEGFVCTEMVFDMKRSGAGIAWDYFMQGQPRPDFINYIEDRDLWTKKLPFGDEFTIALRSYAQTFKVWDLLFNNIDLLIAEGKVIQRYYRLRIEELKKQAYPCVILGIEGMVCNAPYFAASEVAGEICGDTFGICYYEGADGKHYYSLRSRGEFDVSEIATQFGGGGHKNAAGFNSLIKAHHKLPS